MADTDRVPGASVIVPVYNGEATLEACLESLLRLRYPAGEAEFIVVDNGSTDATRAILERYSGRFRILHEARRGPAAARNRGIREARGEAVAFTDADCIVDPDWLAELLPPLAGPGVGIVGGRIRSVEPCNGVERFGERIHDHGRAIETLMPPYAISMNWASPRTALLSVGLFDEGLQRCEDVDLAWRFAQSGRRLAYRESAVVYHHNERTLRGLFAEGYAHGYFAAALRRKHRDGLLRTAPRYSAARQLAGDARRLLGGTNRLDACCALVFDSGKAIGDSWARLRRASPRAEAAP